MTQIPSPGRPNRSLAFFDVDGTLTEGFTVFSFAQFLHGKGFFDLSCLRLMQQDRAIYQKSERGEADYHEFAVNLVLHYAQGLAGQQVEQIQSFSPSFLQAALEGQIPDYGIHGFARELVELLNPLVKTIAISGSPWESLSPLAAYLGLQELHTTLLGIEQGLYTGQVDRNLATSEAKRQLVGSYLLHDVDRKTSFAFGDSVQDIPMLEVVDNAFVLGENEALQDAARRRGWEVLSAEGDAVGRLKSRIASVFGG